MEYSNKPERLASAVYLITSFFGDQEPLKWKLRTLASELIPLAMSLSDKLAKEREVVVWETRNLILKIGKLFVVAKNAGLISTDNHELMQEELKKYINTVDRPSSLSDLLNLDSPKATISTLREPLMIKDKNEDKVPDDKSLKNFGAVSVKKNSRQSIIISLLKRKKEIMIKDVSPLINGCSEKTIQRELSAMVKNGVLKRTGEKRWSRYSLA